MTRDDTYQKIKRCEYTFPSDILINEDMRDLIISMLQLVPERRPSIDEVLESKFLRS